MAKHRVPVYRMSVFLPDARELSHALGVDAKGKVQRHVTATVMRKLRPYLPIRTGRLRDSMAMEPTLIRVSTPYARAQFFGVTRTGKKFAYRPTGPNVGSHWDRRMVAEQGAAIMADAQRFVRGWHLK